MKQVTVYMKSMTVKHEFMTFKNEREAYLFCEDNNWEWMDENGFVWDLVF